MGDLILAAGFLLCLSLAALAVGWWTANRLSPRRTFGFAVGFLTVFLYYAFRYHGTWQIARLLPFSGVIVLGNFIPVGGGFFAGLSLGQSDIPRWRRCGLVLLISILACYSVACSLIGQLPACSGLMENGARSSQSRQSSCGAYCAAALLNFHGIEATEEEMLPLCLTSHRGSPALGLYRGLKRKTAGTEWDVEVVTGAVDKLVATRGPLLMRVLLPSTTVLGYGGRKIGFIPRVEHAVLLIETRDDGRLLVLDPAVKSGHVLWTVDYVRDCSQGEALRLRQRPSAG